MENKPTRDDRVISGLKSVKANETVITLLSEQEKFALNNAIKTLYNHKYWRGKYRND